MIDDGPVSSVNLQKINPNGGSLAIGHPFAATGSFNHLHAFLLKHLHGLVHASVRALRIDSSFSTVVQSNPFD
jgi:acetyl-CoA acetyltransferase